MARPRKPLNMQTKHLRVVERQKRQMEQDTVAVSDDQLNKPPEWLINTIAISEWGRLVKELNKIEIIGNLDLNNLGAYCNAYANYRDATEQLKNSTLTIEKLTQYGIQLVENPLINIQKKYSDEMKRYAALCGLTIDSRLKAGSGKIKKQEDTIERKFGTI